MLMILTQIRHGFVIIVIVTICLMSVSPATTGTTTESPNSGLLEMATRGHPATAGANAGAVKTWVLTLDLKNQINVITFFYFFNLLCKSNLFIIHFPVNIMSKKIIICECGNEMATAKNDVMQCGVCYATIHLENFVDHRYKK